MLLGAGLAFRVAGVGSGVTCCVAGRRFCVAGAGNRAQQLKPLDFVALREKSAARVRVDV